MRRHLSLPQNSSYLLHSMWCIAALAIVLPAAIAQDVEAEAVKYLTDFGYIETNGDTRPFVDDTLFNDAVTKFQDFAGLEKTGRLDAETQELMKTPRCGMDDRVANFVTQGSDWKRKAPSYPMLTYRINKYPTTDRLSRRDVDEETRKAFRMWEDSSALQFQEGSSGQVDIEISFERFDHGDGNAFDGKGGVLAHAFFPQFGGTAHFDDTEDWSVTEYVGNQLLNTLTHEFGHSLGLRHSKERNSIMAPFYKGWDPALKLEEDDIKGIQAIYGRNQNTYNPADIPTRNTPTVSIRRNTPTVLIPTDELCDSKIDAMVQTSDGSPYVFKGDKYWMMTDDRLAPGYPKKISDSWPGLPSNIDAALTWKSTGYTFFFKGNQYWRFTDRSPSPGYPKDISNWQGLPSNLDAAIEWGKDGDLYFFAGSQYWKYDTDNQNMARGYPRDMSAAWQDVPGNVDAALKWSNGKTYFFKSGKYWRFNDDTGAVDRKNPSFPRDAGLWWFGCPKKKRLTIPFTDGTVEIDTEN